MASLFTHINTNCPRSQSSNIECQTFCHRDKPGVCFLSIYQTCLKIRHLLMYYIASTISTKSLAKIPILAIWQRPEPIKCLRQVYNRPKMTWLYEQYLAPGPGPAKSLLYDSQCIYCLRYLRATVTKWLSHGSEHSKTHPPLTFSALGPVKVYYTVTVLKFFRFTSGGFVVILIIHATATNIFCVHS